MIQRPRRRGVFIVYLMAIFALIAILLSLFARQSYDQRQQSGRRTQQMQAHWLARAGVDLARARWKDDPKFAGETWKLLDDGTVVVEVQGNDIISAGTFENVTREIRSHFAATR